MYMRDRRAYLRSMAVVATGVTVAGCSGDGDGDGDGGGSDGSDGSDDGDSTPAATATATPAMTTTGGGSESGAQSEYPDYNWDQLEGVSATDATTVEITGFSYDPLVARVPTGQAIAFPNADSVPHTVTAPAADVDVTVQPGEDGSVTINDPGTYDYVCRFHPPEMLGRLVVVEGMSVDETTPTATPGSPPTDAPAGTDTQTGDDGGVY
ncbi:MAG: cupredoxin domain-containing protein [Haloarculaceae archaeon]